MRVWDNVSSGGFARIHKTTFCYLSRVPKMGMLSLGREATGASRI